MAAKGRSMKRAILTTALLLALPVGVAAQSAPDLEVAFAEVDDSTPVEGGRFKLWVTVGNFGDADSAATTLRYYQSTDATISSADTQVGTVEVEAVETNRISQESIELTAPSTAGTYYYGACVDAVAGESDTTDNCTRRSVTVEVVATTIGSDLVFDGTIRDDITLKPGETFRILVIVRNQGAEWSTRTTVRFYSSTDVTITTSDTEMGTKQIPPLRPLAGIGRTIPLTAPSTAGTYYYGACVDAVSGELDTTNNCSNKVLRVDVSEPSTGGGGTRQTVPGAPTNLLVEGGDGQVTLTWDAPEDAGGSAITDYEVRINQTGEWISIGSTDTTHTVTGLVNGATYVFQVRAVNAAGKSSSSNRAEATPEVFTLDFAHFANGAGIISDLVFVNVATHPIRPVLYFYGQEGHLIDPESMVDLTEDLEVTEDGALSVRTEMEPLGELTISTHGRGVVVSGSVQVVSDGPIGGVLRFDLPGIGVAGVGASQPVRDVIFPARRRGGLSTAVAIRNLGEEALGVSCRLMSGGIVLEEVELSLEANGQEARYIEELFTGTDTSDFVGSVRCTAPGLFTGIAVELDDSNRIFTTLPVVPVARTGGGGQGAGLDFAHFANGAGIISGMVFVNLSTQPSGPGPTPFHTVIRPTRPVLYFYDKGGNLIAPESVVDLTGDLEVTEDGALSIHSEMGSLEELTISTHGRGVVVTGSVTVISEGPIGGVLRFDLPGIGVAGVGASQPVRDAIFPARRLARGISTAAAIRNLGEDALEVSCQLMKDGAVLEEVEISLEANGQEARYIEEMFTSTDTSDFVGSVRCTAPPGEGMFTGVAVELDASNQIFTTLPVVPVPERVSQE